MPLAVVDVLHVAFVGRDRDRLLLRPLRVDVHAARDLGPLGIECFLLLRERIGVEPAGEVVARARRICRHAPDGHVVRRAGERNLDGRQGRTVGERAAISVEDHVCREAGGIDSPLGGRRRALDDGGEFGQLLAARKLPAEELVAGPLDLRQAAPAVQALVLGQQHFGRALGEDGALGLVCAHDAVVVVEAHLDNGRCDHIAVLVVVVTGAPHVVGARLRHLEARALRLNRVGLVVALAPVVHVGIAVLQKHRDAAGLLALRVAHVGRSELRLGDHHATLEGLLERRVGFVLGTRHAHVVGSGVHGHVGRPCDIVGRTSRAVLDFEALERVVRRLREGEAVPLAVVDVGCVARIGRDRDRLILRPLGGKRRVPGDGDLVAGLHLDGLVAVVQEPALESKARLGRLGQRRPHAVVRHLDRIALAVGECAAVGVEGDLVGLGGPLAVERDVIAHRSLGIVRLRASLVGEPPLEPIVLDVLGLIGLERIALEHGNGFGHGGGIGSTHVFEAHLEAGACALERHRRCRGILQHPARLLLGGRVAVIPYKRYRFVLIARNFMGTRLESQQLVEARHVRRRLNGHIDLPDLLRLGDPEELRGAFDDAFRRSVLGIYLADSVGIVFALGVID